MSMNLRSTACAATITLVPKMFEALEPREIWAAGFVSPVRIWP